MRRRTWIVRGLPFGRFIASPLTPESIGTMGLYLMHRYLDDLDAVQLAPADLHWMRRALAEAYNACSVHPWDVYSFEANRQARALHALETVRRELARKAGLTEDEAPHRWQGNAWSLVASMPRLRRRAGSSLLVPENVVRGPWPRPRSSSRGRGPKGGA